MPLRAGKSQATVSGNISEMMHSRTFASGKSAKKRRQMAVAAAMEKSRHFGHAGARASKKGKK